MRVFLKRILPLLLIGTGGSFCRAEDGGELVVRMEDCNASRAGHITGTVSILRMLFAGPPMDTLVKKGVVEVDGQPYAVYLPKAKSYAVKNDKSDDSFFENTSTAISVDQNSDEKLSDDETWFANLPIRISDTMFDVVDITQDGSRITLAKSNSPLRGVVMNRKCPDFLITTTNGNVVTRESLSGKAFLLDIWSVT